LALRVRFDDGAGFDATEAATEKRLAVYVVLDPSDIDHVVTLGPDPLDASAFTVSALADALRAAGASQIKGVLTDQRVIAGVGNAYSDEALHAARLSPFKQASKLSAEEVERLWSALVSVLRDAVSRSAGLPASGLKSEKKSGMRVHGRAGEACPVCGDTVRSVSFATKSLQYCPTCQTGGKPLADRRLSRLLK
jgi:formamidopyrimidine-DNA glycosylase